MSTPGQMAGRYNTKRINGYFVEMFYLIIVLFGCDCIFAKEALRKGETLPFGEYLVSENRQYVMGLEAVGYLAVVDVSADILKPKKDGTLWVANAQNPTPNGRLKFNENKEITLYDRNDRPIWKIDLRSAGDADLMMYLENTGRLIIFSGSKRIWCSCPFCYTNGINEDKNGFGINEIFYRHPEVVPRFERGYGIPMHLDYFQRKTLGWDGLAPFLSGEWSDGQGQSQESPGVCAIM
jgi:hypothetical protein